MSHNEGGSVDYINEYCRSKLDGALRCETDAAKGRVLIAARRFERGSRLFVEPPLLLVAEDVGNESFAKLRRLARQKNFAHGPLWYWSALCSLTEDDLRGCDEAVPPASAEQQKRLLLLCHPGENAEEASTDVSLLVDYFWPRSSNKRAIAAKLDRLLVVWLLNCFEHSEDPQGFSTFFLPAFMSHSCRPNCMWHYDGDDFVLRARETIEPDQEVTVSYLSEEGTLFFDTSRQTPMSTASGACAVCGFLADVTQVALLCAQEARVERMVLDWDRKASRASPDQYLTDAVALRLETNFNGLFSKRHWLRDRCSRHLISYYEATGRADLALPLAKQCVEFIAASYPGCSAAHAWALETEGDLMLRTAGFRLSGPAAVIAPQVAPAEALTRAFQEVHPIYEESAGILRILFGEAHEFYTTMVSKIESLAQAVHT